MVGCGKNLCVDANARFDLKEALAFAEAIHPYDLMWYEEPLDPDDFLSHAILAESLLLLSQQGKTCSQSMVSKICYDMAALGQTETGSNWIPHSLMD